MGRWIVCSAWPYVNSVPHLGNMIGSVLSADVYARFLRLMGEEVVFVSGSDEHGTPIEVEARKRGIEPRKFTDEVHSYIVKLFKEWDISFDNYTRTESLVHRSFVKEFFMKIYERGYVFSRKMVLPFCPRENIFLPDRFVEGVCPYCGYEHARGDQCESCGTLLDPTDLIDPRCVFCHSRPIFVETVHWFFDLPKVSDELKRWLEENETLEKHVKEYALSMVRGGLKPRSITRDNKWGIEAPFPGAEGKTIYVWFEALLGYLSATLEYFIHTCGNSEEAKRKFEEYWKGKDTKTVFFIGKDNIPFHAVILPALLLAAGEGYVLPYKIPATEYLMFEGDKFSKSRGIGVWIDEALKIVPDPDYWRYALIRMRPEERDSNFTWREFVRIVNSELNDNIGNFIHRVLSFVYSRFLGRVPSPTKIYDEDLNMLEEVRKLFREYVELMYEAKLKPASDRIVEIAKLGNAFLNRREPWKLIREKPDEAASAMYVLTNVVRGLGLVLAPITPRAATRLWRMLKLGDEIPRGALRSAFELVIEPGHELSKPEPLFRKLPPDFLNKVNELVAKARREAEAERPSVLK